ncbi:diguanylate cyclase with PAS/PAC sensor [methanotrophic bacterial endosymbiont of Bathymodiolus sp.]|nr:diguanylate cyclase with PAS/PAC sensor [methanotrophic bacterial endosymbiont of Bathymodiolus sp.]
MNDISKEEKQVLNQLWSAPIELPGTPEMLGKSHIIFILCLFSLLLWGVQVKRQVRRLKITQKELLSTNDQLHEVNENLSNQALLDTKQLLNSEHKFRNMIENLHDECLFYQHDSNGVLNYLSPSISNVLGYSVEQFTQHHHRYQTDHPDNSKIAEYTRRCLAGEKVPAYQIELVDSNDAKRTLKIQETQAYDQQGQCIGLSVV